MNRQGFPKLVWPLQNIRTDGERTALTDPNRVLQARPGGPTIILELLWPLQDIQTDGLVGFTGSNRVLLNLDFRIMIFGKPEDIFCYDCHGHNATYVCTIYTCHESMC